MKLFVPVEVMECAVCHAATQSLARLLEDPKVIREVDHVLEKTCRWVPGTYYSQVCGFFYTRLKDARMLFLFYFFSSAPK